MFNRLRRESMAQKNEPKTSVNNQRIDLDQSASEMTTFGQPGKVIDGKEVRIESHACRAGGT